MMGYSTAEIIALVMAETLPKSFHDTVEARYYRKNYPEQHPELPEQLPEPTADPRQMELAL